MKTYTVNNLSLQFDRFVNDDESPPEDVAQSYINWLNEMLQHQGGDGSPCILCAEVVPSQVSIDEA